MSEEEEEEEAIRRITKLLELGGTMLAEHHDCGAPLFRYEGKVICPVCSFDEVFGDASTVTEEMGSGGSGIGLPSPGEEGPVSRGVEGASGRVAGERDHRPEERSFSRLPLAKPISPSREGEVGAMKVKGEADLIKEELRQSILYRLGKLSDKVRNEEDLSRLKSELECMEEALKVLITLER